MSKRATKREIAASLVERDHLTDLIGKYDDVIADVERAAGLTAAGLRDRRRVLVDMRDTFQATAELLAVECDSRKATYSGRFLHRRGGL